MGDGRGRRHRAGERERARGLAGDLRRRAFRESSRTSPSRAAVEPPSIREPDRPSRSPSSRRRSTSRRRPTASLPRRPSRRLRSEPAPEPVETSAEHAPAELEIPPGYSVLEGEPRGGRRAVGIVVSRFNGEVTGRLLDSALEELEALGVDAGSITVMPVPGAFELPLAAMALAKTRRFACIVALGCVIRGDTPHFDYVASEAASGSSWQRSRPASPSRSASSRSTAPTRPRRATTRVPRPSAPHSRWPTSSRTSAPPLRGSCSRADPQSGFPPLIPGLRRGVQT